MISRTTKLYGIIGDRISHLRVPVTFNERLTRDGIDGVCVPLHARPKTTTLVAEAIMKPERTPVLAAARAHRCPT